MDSNVSLILFFLVFAVVLCVLGFRWPAPIRKPDGDIDNQARESRLQKDLPRLVTNFLTRNNSNSYSSKQIAAWGRGWISSRFPILGKIWLPLSWQLYLIPGSSFVLTNQITWFGRRFFHGGEEYRFGKGDFVLGSQQLDTPHLDETERIMPWIYGLWLAPGSLMAQTGVDWQDLGESEIILTVNLESKAPYSFKCKIDPESSLIQAIKTMRTGSRTGEAYPFEVLFSSPVDFEGYRSIPAKYIATWDNDTYIKLELKGVSPGFDVSAVMEAGVKSLT